MIPRQNLPLPWIHNCKRDHVTGHFVFEEPYMNKRARCNGRIPSIELIKPKSHLETLDQADTHSPTFSNPVVLSALCCPRSLARLFPFVCLAIVISRPSVLAKIARCPQISRIARKTDGRALLALTNPELITFSLADFRPKERRKEQEGAAAIS